MTVTMRGAGAPAVGYLEHTREPLLRHLVGGILRRTRRDQRRTLQDVAVEARVSTAYLSEVERGRKEASSEVLAAVCDALGMRLVDLVERAWAELALANDSRVVDLTRSAPAGFRPGRDGAPGAGSGVGQHGEAVLLAA